MARPKIPIDESQVEKLAERQWNNYEIAAFFKCGEPTIRRRFGALIESAQHAGRSKLKDVRWAAIAYLNGIMSDKEEEKELRIKAASKLLSMRLADDAVITQNSGGYDTAPQIRWVVVTDPQQLSPGKKCTGKFFNK